MKVAVIYPVIRKNKQYPLLTQNRHFRYSSSLEVRIFPLVPAMAATILKTAGHNAVFMDGINARMTEEEFDSALSVFNPQVIAMETKTPIIRRHWEYINNYKKAHPECLMVLFGDHVTFFPQESMENSNVDFVLTGGDYDVSLKKLIDHLEGKSDKPKGIYYREGKEIKNSGNFELIQNLDELPFIDRDLTKWELYGEAYLHHPCAYILTGRGCGGHESTPGQCRFCIWQHAFWRCSRRLRSPKNVVREIKQLINKYKIQEIFDDNEAGAVWNIEWMREFHDEMKREKLLGKVLFSSNARADSLTEETCKLMKKTGFRLIKVGLETGNNESLRRLRKQETIEQIMEGVKTAKRYGLIVMLTSMMGYPWETDEEAKKTYEAGRELMLYKTRFGDSLQSSVIIPYPGTPLYDEALKNNWFIDDPKNYERFDMSEPILKSGCDSNKWCQKMWKIHYEPKFLIRSFLTLHSWHDIKLAFQGIRSLVKHVKDFE
ncbi:radical SAM protein [Candidatus Desantisbacteria bacterium]|nr:radical SAM protein [Candidatus Desantisbacteria bacterium]